MSGDEVAFRRPGMPLICLRAALIGVVIGFEKGPLIDAAHGHANIGGAVAICVLVGLSAQLAWALFRRYAPRV